MQKRSELLQAQCRDATEVRDRLAAELAEARKAKTKAEEEARKAPALQKELELTDEISFEVIEELEKHGVSAAVRPCRETACVATTFRTATSWRAPRAQDAKKLKEAGHQTFGSVKMECKKKLTQVRGLSEAKVERIIEAAAKITVRIAHCPLS
jgi:hypothetical protein